MSEVCHFKCELGSHSLATCSPVRRISEDAGAAVCKGPQSVIPHCSPGAQGLKKLKKTIVSKGLWRPGGWSVQSLGLCRRALQFLQ